MFKSIWGARFREGMTSEAARDYWTKVHGPLGAKVPGSIAYVQNHMVGAIDTSGIVSTHLALDGYACEWWPDRATFDTGMRSPEWQALVDDDTHVFAEGSGAGLCASVEERLLRDGKRGAFKIVRFLRFRADLEREEANAYWLNEHGPLAAKVPGLGRYLQNHVLSSLGPFGVEGDPVVYDGFSEWWFSDREAFARATETKEWAAVVEDSYGFLEANALSDMSGIVDERVIKCALPR